MYDEFGSGCSMEDEWVYNGDSSLYVCIYEGAKCFWLSDCDSNCVNDRDGKVYGDWMTDCDCITE